MLFSVLSTWRPGNCLSLEYNIWGSILLRTHVNTTAPPSRWSSEKMQSPPELLYWAW